MKNITLTLDDKTAAWVRNHAARQGKSVSPLMREILHRHMRDTRDYREAMRRFQAIEPIDFEWGERRRPTREDLNLRPRFR